MDYPGLINLTGTSFPSEEYQKVREDRYVTKIVVSEMKMLGGNKTDGESHVAAPAASAANKGKTTKTGRTPEFDDGSFLTRDLSKTQLPTGGIIPHGGASLPVVLQPPAQTGHT